MHSEFPLSETIIHLNHAGVGPWPKRTVEVVKRFAEENMFTGSRDYRDWMKIEQELRELCRWLINAKSIEDIALLKNTSEGLSMVASGIRWQPGDNVVTSQHEFPSNRIVWESLKERFGVTVRMADLGSAETPELALINLIDDNTRLLAVSSVQYATGIRMDLEQLGQACRAHDSLLCVDAIQSLGVVPFDVQSCQADFVVADGHKWMLAPEGLALFYVNPKCREELQLSQYGWHMLEDMSNYDRLEWTPASTSRRFECGSPNNLGVHALHASLSLIKETGIQTIFDNVSRNITHIYDYIINIESVILSSMKPSQRSGIITFKFPGIDNARLVNELQNHGILCAYRAGGVRLSPHFYTEQSKIDSALKTLRRLLDSRDVHHGHK